MGIIFSSLKYCCFSRDKVSEPEEISKLNNLQFEELQKGLKYYLIYKRCH